MSSNKYIFKYLMIQTVSKQNSGSIVVAQVVCNWIWPDSYL